MLPRLELISARPFERARAPPSRRLRSGAAVGAEIKISSSSSALVPSKRSKSMLSCFNFDQCCLKRSSEGSPSSSRSLAGLPGRPAFRRRRKDMPSFFRALSSTGLRLTVSWHRQKRADVSLKCSSSLLVSHVFRMSNVDDACAAFCLVGATPKKSNLSAAPASSLAPPLRPRSSSCWPPWHLRDTMASACISRQKPFHRPVCRCIAKSWASVGKDSRSPVKRAASILFGNLRMMSCLVTV
mmetsp:Transcript_85176/g.182540  ORF Transcript_85176/g.182540 Transcript_85176/m.182540 type:complete len:241 (-) Transcript_85176:506-1228(-)